MAKVRVKIELPISRNILKITNGRYINPIALEIISMMKEFIEAGKSPVKGEGRFEGYKAVEGARDAKSKIRKANLLAKSGSAKTKGRALNIKADASNRLRKAKMGYPFNVQDKFPNKTARPVNLLLSGDMLGALDYKPTKGGVEVGIFDKDEAKKAKTHQEGLNGVPKRRFMPSAKGEDYIVSIRARIKKMFVEALDKIIRSE